MYGNKYILPFTNDLGELYEIYFDFLNYTGASSLLQGTDDVLTLRCTAGDEDKLQPILGTEAMISIWIDQTTSLSIFDLIATIDNQIRVTVYRNENYSSCIFQGFIVVEDNSQPFLDPPFALSVRALDGLGLLKNVDLGDLNNQLYQGPQSVISWIMQILYKTDQTLNLRAYFNFYNTAFNQSVGALEQVYLDASTFYSGGILNPDTTDPTIDVLAEEADDCYTALEKIVRCFRCRLFQENGVWNLVSLYEYLNPIGFTYHEYALGNIVGGLVDVNVVATASAQDYTAAVGKNEMIIPVLEDQMLYLKLATKWLKLTYTYNQAANKIINQDLSGDDAEGLGEGTPQPAQDEVISSSVIDSTYNNGVAINLQTNAYTCFGYTPMQSPAKNNEIQPGLATALDPSNVFVRRVYDTLSYELVRFLVVKLLPAPNISYAFSTQLLLDTNDILQITFSWRTRSGTSQNGANWSNLLVFLYGDDGSHWALGCFANGSTSQLPTKWYQTDENFEAGGAMIAISSDAIPDTTKWSSVEVNTSTLAGVPYAQAPVNGRVVILFVTNDGPGTEFWYKDINVTILPYLNGSFQQVAGDYNYAATNLNIVQTESDDVEISDSPKRYFKGAPILSTGELCTPQWARKGVSESYRFTQAMEYIMYNHLRRIFQKIEGTFRGLIYVPAADPSDERPNGFLCSYAFSDHPVPTKRFILTSFEKNYATGQSKNVYIETLADANDTGWTLPDAYQFSYIFQS